MAHHIIHRGAISGGNLYSPDFDGLTRIEWTAESLSLADSDPVSSWVDVSSSLELTQTGTARPTYSSTGYVDFDGSDDEMPVSGLNIDMSGGLSVFIVMDRDAAATSEGPISMLSTTSAGHGDHAFEVYNAGSENSWVAVEDRDTGTTDFFTTNSALYATTGAKTLWAIRMDSTISPDEQAWRVDGSSGATVATTRTPDGPDNPIETITLGHGLNSAKFDGRIYDICIYYGRAMTLAETQSVETSLNTRFSVY